MGLITPVELPSLDQLGAVHFIAIGGSGMNGIASMMLAQGIRVSGSDRQDSKYLRVTGGARRPRLRRAPRRAARRCQPRWWRPRPFGRTTPSWRRRGGAGCGCCIAVPRWVR